MRSVTRVLLYVLYPSHFKVIVRVARLLAASRRYEPLLFFDKSPPFERDWLVCRDAGITCLGPDGEPILGVETVLASDYGIAASSPGAEAPKSSLARALAWIPERAKDWLRNLRRGLFAPIRSAREIRQVVDELRFLRRLVAKTGARLAVLPGDSIGYGTPFLVKAIHEKGGAAMIVPFTISNAGEVVGDLRRFPEYSLARIANRAVGRLFPRWVYSDAKERLFRTHPARALAFEAFGLAPPKPWVLNSGHADALAAESAFMMRYYEREGLPPERCILTGTVGDDAVARSLRDAAALREELYRELGLPPGKPLIVTSLSDYSHFFKFSTHAEFENYEELVHFWLDSLETEGWNVVISLHPWMRYDDKRHLERRHVKISQRAIEELIPLCDIYVVSISATVRTAIACGKPVVDHDVFSFRLTNFAGMDDSVFIVETRADFAAVMRRLTTEPAFLSMATAAQAARAAEFGCLDGRSGERLLQLVDDLTSKGERA